MQRHSLGREISKVAYEAEVITAGAGKDGVAQTGEIINRSETLTVDGITTRANYDYANFIANLSATLAEDETAIFTLRLKTSDSATFASGVKFLTEEWELETANTNAVTATKTLTGDTGGSTETGVLNLKALLDSCLAYVRVEITCTLSAADTDTAILSVVGNFGDSQNSPLDTIDAPSIDN